MRHVSLFLLLFVPAVLSSQQILLNEVYNSGGSDEWVELLVVQSGTDLRGWDLRDFNSGGTPQEPLVFTNSSLWSGLPAGTVIIVARPGASLEEDVDPRDFRLTVKSDNDAFFSGTAFSFAGTSDAIQVRDAESTHVFGVSWGSGNIGSLPEPHVHFDGSFSSNTSAAFLEDSTGELTDAANWEWSSDSITPGLGNSPQNASWIGGLSLSGDGTGSVVLDPDTLMQGSTDDLAVTFRPDAVFTASALRIMVPPPLGWSRLISDVTLTGASGDISINGDTVTIANLVQQDDSVGVILRNATAPDSSGSFDLIVQSRGARFATVYPVPVLVITDVTAVDEGPGAPPSFVLFQNYPNPFNPSTTFSLSIPQSSPVTLTLYDILGRRVATLIDGVLQSGQHAVRWEAQGQAGGIYFALLRSGGYVETRKIVLMK